MIYVVRTARVLAGLAILAQLPGCGGDGSASQPPPPPITVAISPGSALVPAGTTQALTVTLQNDTAQKGVSWSIAPATGAGTLSDATATSVTYNAPANPPSGDVAVTITATSVADQTGSASAAITVPAIQVSITPATSLVPAGSTQSFTAQVLYDPAQKGVTWSISPATGAGTLSDVTSTSVTYNGPASPPPTDVTITITATSVSSAAVSGTTTFTLPASVVSISPAAATVPAGSTQALTATVQYDPGQTGVSWSLSPATGAGTLSDITTTSATYHAPASAPTSDTPVTITATSNNIPAVVGTATMTVPAIVVAVAPTSALTPVNAVQLFSGSTMNDPTTLGVTWSLNQGGTACAPACGTITPVDTRSASYVAPAAVPSNPSVTLVATSVADGTKTATAAISLSTGTVQLAPADLNFGRIAKTRTASKAITLTNTGATPLTITAVDSPDAKFPQTNNCGSSVAAAASCDITVTFKPALKVGTFSGTLTIADSSPDSPQQVPLTGVSYRTAQSYAAVRSVLSNETRMTTPAPTGAMKVGTRVMELVDTTRADPYLTDGSRRRLSVRFWYPASVDNDCASAPYADAQVWDYFSRLVGVRLPAVQTHSCLQARVLTGAFPVVVFTHGFTGTFTDYTFLFEDLASRGYVVASVDHTFEATAVVLADGRLARGVLGSHLQSNTQASEQVLTTAESTRLADLRFVVGELRRINNDSRSALYAHLDMASIAVAGHSLGGLTALQALQQDPRIRAAVSLEGLMPDIGFDATDKPVLVLDAGRTQWTQSERRLWRRLQGPHYAVNLQNAEHVAPTDAVWLAPGAIQTGGASAAKTVAAVRDYVAAFLDTSLQGRSVDPLLVRPSRRYAGAEVGGPP